MPKIITIVLLVTCLCRMAQAQVLIAVVFGDKLNTDKLEFGLVVSPTLTNITGLGSSVKPGLSLGLYFNIKITDRFFLAPEAMAKSSFGAWGIAPYPTGNDSLDHLFAGGSVQRSVQALSLPLLARYRLVSRLFAEAGFQVDLIVQAKDNFKVKVDDSQLSYLIKVKDQFTTFDFGLTGGLIYKIKKDKGMGVGVRYFRGLTDVLKTQQGSQVNSVWLLNITIPIGSGSTKPAGKTQ